MRGSLPCRDGNRKLYGSEYGSGGLQAGLDNHSLPTPRELPEVKALFETQFSRGRSPRL